MIYRDAGVAVKQILFNGNRNGSFISHEDNFVDEVGLHPEQFTRLKTSLDPDTAVYDRWRLYRIHHFAVVADQWKQLTQQVTL